MPTASYPLLLKQLLFHGMRRTPEREIVYRDLVRYGYGELRRRVARAAGMLVRLGVKMGDTVAVMDWDSHRYLECMFAAPMLGAALQTVNIRLSPDQICYTLNHAAPQVLLINGEFLPVLAAIEPRLETVATKLLMTDSAAALPAGFAGEYEAFLAAESPAYDFPDFDENARATIFYTTGTTGAPKGVTFSHRQLVLHTLVGLANYGTATSQGRLHRDDVYMPIAPMFHAHGWGFPYAATTLGIKQVFPGRYLPEVLLGLIEKEGVTFSACVPTILHMLLTCPASAAIDLSRWKVAVGGAALPKGLARAALERGIDVFSGYGMSETCPGTTTAHLETTELSAPLERQLEMRTKTGRTLPLVELRVVDGEMHDLPQDGASVGEVVIRSPWLTEGYWKNPEASEQLWAGGYLHTGDTGNIDAEGYLQVTDRLKDVIKSGGEWISSLQIEDIISQHDAVSEVAVIGVPSEKWGERPLALVVLCPGSVATAEDIRAHVGKAVDRGTVSKFAIPERVLFVDALARTSVGKLDKKALRTKYRTAEPAPAATELG
jgi:fatty-acyl-CoA synthase